MRRRRRRCQREARNPPLWCDLVDGLPSVWDTLISLATIWLTVLVNLTALALGLLPFVAREAYHIDQTGLGTLVASFALGSLIGSISASFAGRGARRG